MPAQLQRLRQWGVRCAFAGWWYWVSSAACCTCAGRATEWQAAVHGKPIQAAPARAAMSQWTLPPTKDYHATGTAPAGHAPGRSASLAASTWPGGGRDTCVGWQATNLYSAQAADRSIKAVLPAEGSQGGTPIGSPSSWGRCGAHRRGTSATQPHLCKPPAGRLLRLCAL